MEKKDEDGEVVQQSSRVIQNMESKKRFHRSPPSYNMAMDGHRDRPRSVDRALTPPVHLLPTHSPSLLQHPTAETRTVIADVSIQILERQLG